MRKASALLVACVMGLTACGAVTDPDEVTPPEYVVEPEVADAAVAAFGEDEVDQAFAEITEFSLDEGFPAELLRNPQDRSFTATELAGDLDSRFTPEALEVWRELTAAAAAGDEEARHAVQAIRFFDIDEPTWQPVPDEDPVVRQQISGGEIGVATPAGDGPVLEVAFAHTAILQYLNEQGLDVQADVRKELTYRLTPAPAADEVDWLITDFDGTYSFPTADEAD